ncbi:hypothetical protein WR25_26157 [Diploscapter pachys]|uniref:Very-long-chain (3R)-3-hydroxyacyl-CoA dehydratase n=1 Tax=Diploscapter pachys TaxID=2018661 RepID=A0A2A2J5T3_9BILA|nr:hypothetical protein WR25_26157 [Diploscapter pachys]
MAALRQKPWVKWWLLAYNTMMFLIHLVIIVDLWKERQKGTFSYASHFEIFRLATTLQIIDLLHGLAKLTQTDVRSGALQVFGRLFILYSIHANPNLYIKTATYVLLVVYAVIETIRYPYYGLRAFNYELYAVTWLRYNAWIVLYPLGFVCEAISMYQSIPYFWSSDKWSLHLPRPLNFSISFAYFMSLTLFGVLPYAAYHLLNHMAAQRRAKFGRKYR